MSNVVFINTLYCPGLHERNKNRRLQEEIEFTIKYIAYDSRDRYEYAFRKEQYHHRMKERIKLVTDDFERH